MKTIFTLRIILVSATLLTAGCFGLLFDKEPDSTVIRKVKIETTGYCPCGKCCSWKYNWLFQPVFSSGKNKGKRKKVGQCADGTMAEYGTLAADTRFYPFGTKLKIPGYGIGTVHDRGGAIQGRYRLDLYFDDHEEALEWGRKTVTVSIIE